MTACAPPAASTYAAWQGPIVLRTDGDAFQLKSGAFQITSEALQALRAVITAGSDGLQSTRAAIAAESEAFQRSVDAIQTFLRVTPAT